MKHMKKLLALMLALLMVFAMVACDSSSGGGGKGSGGSGGAKAVAKSFAKIIETGKASDLADLIHEDIVKAEEMTFEDFDYSDVRYTVELDDGSEPDADMLDELTNAYDQYWGLEVEEVQVFEADITEETEEEEDTWTEFLYVVKIDGKWYLDCYYTDIY